MIMIIEILILAVVQGLTEFLPVSSSGHLAIGAAIFAELNHPLDSVLTSSIALHLGTLAAIVLFFHRRILQLVRDDSRVISLIVVGSIPAAVFGLFAKKFLEDYLTHPLLAGLMLPMTGLALLWAARHQDGTTLSRDLSYRGALVIGLFQAIAILPGISRSGMTIASGLWVGLRREEAAVFSFLLGIPAMAGAGVLEGIDVWMRSNPSDPLIYLAAGGALSFAVGLFALWWLIRWLKHGILHYFAWWVIPLGLGVIVWQTWLLFRL